MRYFFDVDGDGGATLDAEGTECRDVADMRRRASRILAEIAADTSPSNDRVQLIIKVRNTGKSAVYEARLIIEGRELT